MPKIDPNSLELEERVVKTNKCQKTHKGGRTLSWNALVVVGDGHGHVGAAIGKARGIPDAIRKGFESAKKELIRVPLAASGCGSRTPADRAPAGDHAHRGHAGKEAEDRRQQDEADVVLLRDATQHMQHGSDCAGNE